MPGRRLGIQTHQGGAIAHAVARVPDVRWVADYDDSPDFNQWAGGVQQFAAGYAKIVQGAATDHAGPGSGRLGSGKYAQARAVAGNLVLGGERTEWLSGDPQSGSSNFSLDADEWYGWSSFLPTDYPHDGAGSGRSGGLWTQFHSVDSAQANIQVFLGDGQFGWGIGTVLAPRLCIGINGGNNPGAGQSLNVNSAGQTSIIFDLGDLPLARWFDIVLHCVFKDTLASTFQVWLDGTKLVDRTDVALLYTTQANGYIKQGVYRSTAVSTGLADGYIWHDQFRRGGSYADVDSSH